jgi:basic amino acid/polyamine antiporter, APA family
MLAMAADTSLKRVLGLPGAVAMGLGSIVGTGIFVTIGTAAGIAGASLLIAIALAALVATCNGLASAQLAAAHPVSGGAYEYGYRYLGPWPGRLAGVTFVCAKTASAATAALGFGGYVLALAEQSNRVAQIGLAVGAVILLTAIVVGGMRRSHRLNLAIVTVTLGTLVIFVIACVPSISAANYALGTASAADIAHATALVFVAYTGYGRIATLGEEVRDPAHTIPRAIVITLVVTLVLYITVSGAAIGRVGATVLATVTRETSAPLEAIAPTGVQQLVALGAITAMLGVILNLLLGISRVVLAMARRGDLPRSLAHVAGGSPRRAVLATGAVILGLALVGSVKTTWTVSAVTVLIYYSVMNICALRQPAEERRVPRVVPALGLAACAGLAIVVAGVGFR